MLTPVYEHKGVQFTPAQTHRYGWASNRLELAEAIAWELRHEPNTRLVGIINVTSLKG